MSSKELLRKATFALTCFWGPDSQYGCAPGVYRTRVGYCGGSTPDPTYEDLGDHTESVDIDYDPRVTTYEKLLHIFWNNHDPTLCQKRQYMSVIFYHDDNQKCLAEESKLQREDVLKTSVLTKIVPFRKFYNAELYHQKYRLQTFHAPLFESLGLSGEEIISSHVATRLNGYVGGYGTIEAFNEESEELGLSSEWADYVRKQIPQSIASKS